MQTIATIAIILPIAFMAGALGATLTTLWSREAVSNNYWHLVILYAALFILLVWVFMGPYPLGK